MTEYTGEILTIRVKKEYKKDPQLELFPSERRVINNPLDWPCGVCVDIDGKRWDCGGRYDQHILARPDVIDYFTDTSMSQYVGIQSAQWIPYNVEMVD